MSFRAKLFRYPGGGWQPRTAAKPRRRTAAPALMATIQGYLVIAATARPLIPHSSASPCARAMARGLLAGTKKGGLARSHR